MSIVPIEKYRMQGLKVVESSTLFRRMTLIEHKTATAAMHNGCPFCEAGIPKHKVRTT
jgi:hypothetical protein